MKKAKPKKTAKKPDNLQAKIKAMTFKVEERKFFVIVNEDGVVFPEVFDDKKTAEGKVTDLSRKFKMLDGILGAIIGASAAAVLFAVAPAPAYADYDMSPSVERQISDLQSQQSIQRDSISFDRINMEYEQKQMQHELDDQRSKLNTMPMDHDGE